MIDIRAKNEAKIKRRLSNIVQKLSESAGGLDDALYKGGLKIETTAVKEYLSGPRPDKLDRVTGTLAASINTQKQGNHTVSIGTNVEYARIHEYGGTIQHAGGGVGYMPARPFLRPAGDDNKAEISEYIQKYIKYVIRDGA